MSIKEHTILENADTLADLVDAFLHDRKAAGLSALSVKFYRQSLAAFLKWANQQNITRIDDLTPAALRSFLIYLQDTHHNEGGRHVFYRSLRAFLNWYGLEFDRPDFHNPIEKVKPPKLSANPLDPVALDDVRALLDTCKDSSTGARDKAIFCTLLDTGARAAELVALNLADVNPLTGEVIIKRGKGNKSRVVFLGKAARRALRAYLKTRKGSGAALFTTIDGERLTYSGLRQIARRRAALAGIDTPQLHGFRRLFAVSMLRAGVNIYVLAKLMGHVSIQTLQRYLKLLDDDSRAAHEQGSPVDRLL